MKGANKSCNTVTLEVDVLYSLSNQKITIVIENANGVS